MEREPDSTPKIEYEGMLVTRREHYVLMHLNSKLSLSGRVKFDEFKNINSTYAMYDPFHTYARAVQCGIKRYRPVDSGTAKKWLITDLTELKELIVYTDIDSMRYGSYYVRKTKDRIDANGRVIKRGRPRKGC